jgi:hypothetical protein
MSRDTAIEKLIGELADAERGGWMLAEASDIGAPTIEGLAKDYDRKAIGELLDELLDEAQK